MKSYRIWCDVDGITERKMQPSFGTNNDGLNIDVRVGSRAHSHMLAKVTVESHEYLDGDMSHFLIVNGVRVAALMLSSDGVVVAQADLNTFLDSELRSRGASS